MASGDISHSHVRERRARIRLDDAGTARHPVRGLLAVPGRPHLRGEVVVDPQVVQRRGHRREVTVPDEGVVGEVRRVVEEPVGVGAVEDRSEEEPVEALSARLTASASRSSPSSGPHTCDGLRVIETSASGQLADHRHGGAVRQHEVMSRDHRLEGVLVRPGACAPIA